MRRNGLISYLDARGVLEHGNSEQIERARRDYRRDYQRRYRSAYRKVHREVRFTLEEKEIALLDNAASEIGFNRSDAGKRFLLAHLTNTRVRSRFDREALQAIMLIHSEIRALCRHHPTGLLDRRRVVEQLEERVSALEKRLREPPT